MSWQCITDFSGSYGLPLSLFLVGLFGGFSHCSFMCAPFVLAQSQNSEARLSRVKGVLLLPYHLGRMTTYVVLAVLLNGVINLAFLFSDMRLVIAAPLLLLAATIFLVTAFPSLSSVFPWVLRFQITKPMKFINVGVNKLMKSSGVMQRYGLGVLLGFMPCGMVVSALMASATAVHPGSSALAMVAFSLGTMPALILVALGGRGLAYKYPHLSEKLSRGAMVLSAAWLCVLAGQMIFLKGQY